MTKKFEYEIAELEAYINKLMEEKIEVYGESGEAAYWEYKMLDIEIGECLGDLERYETGLVLKNIKKKRNEKDRNMRKK